MNEERKRLTVIEIETQHFRRCFRGYDPKEVRNFLQELARDYEAALWNNQQLREELATLQEEVERYRTIENTLKEALVLAQRSADETRTNAHREAELILQEARRQAAEIESQAYQKIEHLSLQIETLQARRNALLIELRTLLQTHLQALESLEGPPQAITLMETSRQGTG